MLRLGQELSCVHHGPACREVARWPVPGGVVQASWEGSAACRARPASRGATQFGRCRRRPTESPVRPRPPQLLFDLSPSLISHWFRARRERGVLLVVSIPNTYLSIQDNCAFCEEVKRVVAGKGWVPGHCGWPSEGVGTGAGEGVLSWSFVSLGESISL